MCINKCILFEHLKQARLLKIIIVDMNVLFLTVIEADLSNEKKLNASYKITI